MQYIRIATRQSPLALWQANHVASEIKKHHPNIETILLPTLTEGDKLIDSPLYDSGGKGLFIKALEQALLDNTADIAVHSMKDIPVALPENLSVPVIMLRENPADVFVSYIYDSLEQMPAQAVIGTSSLRRQCQLAYHNPHLIIKPIRGNLDTRLTKLKTEQYDAIILAYAGLTRLAYKKKITEILSQDIMLPAIGQGAIGIECRTDDDKTQHLIHDLHHLSTGICVQAERSVSRQLGGDCKLPIAAHATQLNDVLHLDALVGNPDGTQLLRSHATGAINNPEGVGIDAAEQLIAQGAQQLLAPYTEEK